MSDPSMGQPPSSGGPYGQPGYGQPGQTPYGQPGQPAYGQPGFAPSGWVPPAPKKSRRGLVIGLIVGGLVLFLGCAGGVTTVIWKIRQDAAITLDAPERTAGLVRDDTADNSAQLIEIQTQISGSDGLHDTFAAYYKDPAQVGHPVVIYGGRGAIGSLDASLDKFFSVAGEDMEGGRVSQVTDVDPGATGGALRCGTGSYRSGPTTVCAWAEHYGLVAGVFPDRPVPEASALMVRILGDVVQKD